MPPGCPDDTKAKAAWPQHRRAMERLQLFIAVVERLRIDVTRLDTAAASRTCLACEHEVTCRLWLTSGAAGVPPGCANGTRFAGSRRDRAPAGAAAGHGRSAEMPMDAVRVPA